mgnify:FL=1
MNADVKSFLANLKEVNDTNTVSIKVPSTGKKASFTLFNVSQQKQLLRAAFEGVEGSINQSSIFNSIVQDNCSKEIDFLVSDRAAILIDMRKAVVGNKLTIGETEYNLNDLAEFDSSEFKTSAEVKSSGVTLKLEVPTLKADTNINKKMIGELSKLTDEKKKVQSIEMVLTYEIVKYISKVSIGSNVIDFAELSAYERKAVVNELPLALNNKVITFISDLKELEAANYTFEDGTVVEIDSGFLNAE